MEKILNKFLLVLTESKFSVNANKTNLMKVSKKSQKMFEASKLRKIKFKKLIKSTT